MAILVNTFSILEGVNFLALGILEIIGLGLFLFAGKAVPVKRSVGWLLIGIFVYFLSWRLFLGISGQRHYIMLLLPALPFAPIPLLTRWEALGWSVRWSKITRWIVIAGSVTVLIACFGKNLRPEKRNEVVTEMALLVQRSFTATPPKDTVLVLDNTRRGKQFVEGSGLGLKTGELWIPSDKQELRHGSAIHHIRVYVLRMAEFSEYSEVLLFLHTADANDLKRLIEEDLAQKNYRIIDGGQAKSRENYYWYRLQKTPEER